MKALIERSLYQPAIVLPILMLVRLMTALDFSITQIALVLAFRGTRYVFNMIVERTRVLSCASSKREAANDTVMPRRASLVAVNAMPQHVTLAAAPAASNDGSTMDRTTKEISTTSTQASKRAHRLRPALSIAKTSITPTRKTPPHTCHC